jgi:hypothetical protein
LCKKILLSHLKYLFNACIAQKTHLKIYKKAKTIVLKKPGKKIINYAKVKVYRSIALLNTIKNTGNNFSDKTARFNREIYIISLRLNKSTEKKSA